MHGVRARSRKPSRWPLARSRRGFVVRNPAPRLASARWPRRKRRGCDLPRACPLGSTSGTVPARVICWNSRRLSALSPAHRCASQVPSRDPQGSAGASCERLNDQAGNTERPERRRGRGRETWSSWRWFTQTGCHLWGGGHGPRRKWRIPSLLKEPLRRHWSVKVEDPGPTQVRTDHGMRSALSTGSMSANVGTTVPASQT